MDIILDISDEEIEDLLKRLTFVNLKSLRVEVVRAWLLMIYHNHMAGD